MSNHRKPTYIDLFSGCGGLSLGLHKAGWKGLFAIEKSPLAFETLEHNLIKRSNHFNWPEWLTKSNHEIDDIIKKYKHNLVNLRDNVDMVAGGPPCQGFSSAGKRNESDDRNKLIKSYLKFIMYVRPKLIFFENVKGFTLQFEKNKSKGIAYSQYVTSVLKRLGYDVKGELVDFSAYGIPQKRTRFILIGIRDDVSKGNQIAAKSFFTKLDINREKFLINKGIGLNVTLENAISDLLLQNGYENNKGFKNGFYSNPSSNYQKLMREGSNNNPDSHRFANHGKLVSNKFKSIIDSCGQLSARDLIFSSKKRTQGLLIKDQCSPTLTTLPDDYIHYCEPRILTVREYARIQSFPDSFEIRGKYTTGGKLRTKEVPRYTQIGNAIPPLFGEQSGLVLKQLIKNNG